MRLKALYFTAILGIVGVIVSAYLYGTDDNWASMIGSISTIISIVLGVISIVYTYVSGQATIDLMNQIVNHNASLVEKINSDLAKGNLDEENLKYIRDSLKDQIPPVGIKRT